MLIEDFGLRAVDASRNQIDSQFIMQTRGRPSHQIEPFGFI